MDYPLKTITHKTIQNYFSKKKMQISSESNQKQERVTDNFRLISLDPLT